MNRPTRPSSVASHTGSRRRNLIALTAALIVSAVALAGCAAPSHAPSSAAAGDTAGAEELLAAYDLTDLDVGQVIERLDTMSLAERPADLLASVQPEVLTLRDSSDREARLPMPEDEVYVSVAPFRDRTHECHFHSLTTCVGELADAEIRLTLTGADVEVLIDETRRTYDNGFVGLWVPRGIDATLAIAHEGRAGTVPLSTKTSDDRTCITDLQLL
ncbi:CueP family metal-binding protein [Microbacterium sp. MYb62]|uniref:CueP family metal-binding protein n=1 Tax=Microbacterium sp. MYb62 TaxID=1848690 RepID=UPI000CFE1FFC|nr:CueP family metal-binding protein [Microbacterium sp. MYb62]PRB09569.1 hypothetical protein CQ042_19175 [Microbacterium sp. MYb62]